MMSSFFFFNDTATTEIYTLSLHDALPISIIPCVGKVNHYDMGHAPMNWRNCANAERAAHLPRPGPGSRRRSEEHTSELQSQSNLVCRLLLEKKKKDSTIKYAVEP